MVGKIELVGSSISPFGEAGNLHQARRASAQPGLPDAALTLTAAHWFGGQDCVVSR